MHGKHKSGKVDILRDNPLVIEHVERKHAGKYICAASNEITTTEKSLQVEVECKLILIMSLFSSTNDYFIIPSLTASSINFLLEIYDKILLRVFCFY